MGINQIGYPGAGQITPRVNFQQPSAGPQAIVRLFGPQPILLQAGQAMAVPAGQWQITTGRYTNVQYYDSASYRWRNLPTQPGQNTLMSSDGVNFRLVNTTGTPVGAVISNMGAGNATNGYNTVSATVSAGNGTWGTLVGGSVNTTVTVTTGGNFQWAPHMVWQPASNQTFPYIPPTFYCNINSNGTINTVTCGYGGAGLTGSGSITAVNVPGDNYPGGASLTMQTALLNSGNLTAIWPLTQGTGVSSLPTLSFNIGGGMCANVIMDWTCSNFTVASCGFNLGNKQPCLVVTGNGIANITQNSGLTGADYGLGLMMPRQAQMSVLTDANSNISTNGNLTVMDAGKNLQAIPYLVVIAANANGNGPNGNNPAVLTAIVAGINDTSYIQAM